MKRSELINNLIFALKELDKEYLEEEPYEIKAQYLLNAIEGWGMLPPEIKILNPGQEMGNAFEYYSNEWDEELDEALKEIANEK